MQDNRFKYRIKERRLFYLFIKYPKSHIYYMKIPEYNKTISTGMTNLKAAYIKANEIYTRVSSNSVFKWENNDDFIISRLPNLPEKLTLQIIQKIQNDLLETGISGKTVNNRMGWLHKYIDFPPVPHIKKIRKCYPVEKLYHIGNKNLLALIGITTGMRKGEFSSCEIITKNYKTYLQINGTKTDNAIRKIPLADELIPYINEMKNKTWTDREFRFAVDEIGEYLGIDPHKDNIVFHSYRKDFKTIMMSYNIHPLWQEYYMGHSLDKSNVVAKVYFIPESADDTLVYNQMIEIQKMFL